MNYLCEVVFIKFNFFYRNFLFTNIYNFYLNVFKISPFKNQVIDKNCHKINNKYVLLIYYLIDLIANYHISK